MEIPGGRSAQKEGLTPMPGSSTFHGWVVCGVGFLILMSSYRRLLSIIKPPGFGHSPSFWTLLTPMGGHYFLVDFFHITHNGLSKRETTRSLPKTSSADIMLPPFLKIFTSLTRFLWCSGFATWHTTPFTSQPGSIISPAEQQCP